MAQNTENDATEESGATPNAGNDGTTTQTDGGNTDYYGTLGVVY